MSWDKELKEILQKKEFALQQGGGKNVERQHAKGLLTIRERITSILDNNTFDEIGPGAGGAKRDKNGNMIEFNPANFVLGFGKINGRDCVIGGEDFTMQGGSPTESGLRKSIYIEDLALQNLVPLVRLHQGGGGSVTGASGSSQISTTPVYNPPRFMTVAKTLQAIPVATAALGAVAGLPAARLVASHFSIMTKNNSQVLIAGPKVVERALGRSVTKEDMGGAHIHTRNGVVDNIAEDETDALEQIKLFLSYLPNNAWELPPHASTSDPFDRRDNFLADLVPRDRRKIYDMRKIIHSVTDKDSTFEIAKDFAKGQIICLARINGYPIGIFANDCKYNAGSMTANGSQKVKRFIETCETFNLPIITFVDEPGFMIGPEAEKAATIRHGTDLVLKSANCKLPWASIIVRKSFGVAAVAHYGPNAFVLAWPSAEMGAVPVEGGVAVAFSREIEAHPNPEQRRKELEAEMSHRYSSIPRAEALAVHDLIDPRDTRPMLSRWVERAYKALPNIVAKKNRI